MQHRRQRQAVARARRPAAPTARANPAGRRRRAQPAGAVRSARATSPRSSPRPRAATRCATLLKGDFAVILLDVFMPGMDGYETAQLIREREQTARIPIIFLSAVNKETEHLMRGYAMGAVDYVFKPVDPMMLKSKVSVFVDLYKMRRAGRGARRAPSRNCATPITAPRPSGSRSSASSTTRRQRQAAILDVAADRALRRASSTATAALAASSSAAISSALTGYRADAVRRRADAVATGIHPEDRDRDAALDRAAPTARASRIEYRWRRADGDVRHFLDQAVALDATPTAAGEIAGTLLDVTDRKRARGAAGPGRQDGSDRPADRRRRARFQQSARRGARRAARARAARCARRPRAA